MGALWQSNVPSAVAMDGRNLSISLRRGFTISVWPALVDHRCSAKATQVGGSLGHRSRQRERRAGLVVPQTGYAVGATPASIPSGLDHPAGESSLGVRVSSATVKRSRLGWRSP